MTATRWGICSAGKISHDFVLCMKHLAKDDKSHEAVAVAARSEEDARAFAEKHSIPRHYGNYADLAKDDGIDVIYVSMLHTHHYTTVKMFLEAGKAVLCEKPMTMSSKCTKSLVDIARKNKVFLMEAICTPFLEHYAQMLEGLKEIGPVQHMIIPFGSASLGKVDRLIQYDLGGSLILDCVVYSFNIALDIFKEEPIQHIALGTINDEGVDLNSTIVLKFKDGSLCTMISSATCGIPRVTQICGTKGNIELHSREANSVQVTVRGVARETTAIPKVGDFYYHPWLGGEIKHVRECLQEKLTESPVLPLERSILLAQLMEDSIKKIGGRVKPDVE